MQHLVLFLFTIAVAHASVSVIRSSNDGPHPSSMEIEVQLPSTNKTVRIRLTKSDAFDDVPITVIENGVSRTFSAHQAHHADHAHYRDIESKSVISVRHENQTMRISGHVTHEGNYYFVEPSGDSEHRVTKNIAEPDAQTDLSKLSKWVLSRKKRANEVDTDYEVEIHILCDHTEWNAFKSIYGTDDKVMTELHFYFSHILTGMDTSYRNIGDPSMSVKCIGFTVAKTEADAKWTPPSGSTDANNAGAILGYVKEYAKDSVADHVMGFTRTGIQLGGNFAIAGLAYVGETCRNSKFSIVEDKGLHSWSTASHELAHNLGSGGHDNDEPGCESSKQFIMSSAGLSFDLSNVANSYRFSPCTVKAIKKYINSGKAECLKSRQGTSVAKLTGSVREGARMSLNQVCRLSFPSTPGIFFLTENVQKTPALVCTGLYCSMKAGGHGVTGSGLRAPVGSPCGNKKSCNWNGQCVADDAAPAADDTCFWGDQWPAACPEWKNYIQYLRDYKQIDNAKSYCAKALLNCCQSLKTLCKF